MQKIDSFTIDHLKLEAGLYVSRVDRYNGMNATTFDMRVTAPNKEEVMPTGAIHTFEHLGATFLRNSSIKDRVVYFGPMGCRTGFYLVLFGDAVPQDIVDVITEMLMFIISFEGDIPGATAVECGNYSDQDLNTAKKYAQKYLDALINDKNFTYPL